MANKLQNLGLAYKANKVVLGQEVLNNLSKIKLMFIASDISVLSKNRLLKKCSFYNIKYIDSYSCEELSNALGKKNIKTIGIVDEGFKNVLLK